MTTTTEHVATSNQGDEPDPKGTPDTASNRRRKLRPYILSVPAVVLIIGILYPFVIGILYAFRDYRATQFHIHFIGFDNLTTVFQSSDFWHAVRVTVTYAVAATVVETILGVAVALLLNRSSLVGKIFERALMLPLMIAPVIAAVVWKLMFNPQFGIINHLFGLGTTFNWLGSNTAMMSCVIVDAWIYTPFVAVLVLAGIRSLPREPFEASAVDGASSIYMFRKLMLPMMWPYILVAVIFRFMDSLKAFDIPWVLISGGPDNTTTTLQIAAYLQSIQNFNYSIGATYMLLLWVIVFATARYLVSVLGKAQRRAAGAEA